MPNFCSQILRWVCNISPYFGSAYVAKKNESFRTLARTLCAQEIKAKNKSPVRRIVTTSIPMEQLGRGGDVREAAGFMEAFDISSTASFILRNGFERVALQFPDEILKDSVAVTSALRKEISKQQQQRSSGYSIRLFVMADSTYGSCCADEVAAMHVDAQCIVHYGHTCLSLPSRLPVWFVFGKTAVNAESCAISIAQFAAGRGQSVLVMCGLSYVHALHKIQEQVALIQGKGSDITFVSAPSQLMEPNVDDKTRGGRCGAGKLTSEEDMIHDCRMDTLRPSGKVDDGVSALSSDENGTDTCCRVREGELSRETTGSSLRRESTRECSTEFNLGGLSWAIPPGRGMEEYVLLWIGGDGDPGLTSMALIFNSSTIVRYDCEEDKIVTDVVTQSRFLKRRYYLVERAKEANLVGILVGTLGVDGYEEAIQGIRRMVEASGKKAYVLVMGKPNPSKLANFPECDVFVLVACPQTALFDSKEFLAPIITPFEAELAFSEGKQWTGEYRLDFAMASASNSDAESARECSNGEPRFSFFTGSYVGKDPSRETDVKDASSTAVISRASQHALRLQSESSLSIATTERSVLDIKSGAEYLAARTYQGLDINQEGPEGSSKASLAVSGRKGRAAGYAQEISN